MFFKRRKRDRKEAPIEEKDTKEELKEEPKAVPKAEPKEEPRAVPKAEPKKEPRAVPKAEPKKEPRAVPKAEPKEKPKAVPKAEPKKEPRAVPKAEPKEEPKAVPKAEPKEKPKAVPKAEPKEEPKAVTEEEVMKAPEEPEEENESPTSDDKLREFLRTREAPFTVRMLTRETGLALNDAKSIIQTLLSTEEVATHMVGKTPVYCKTSRFMAAILSTVTSEEVPTFVQEENRRLMDKITALDQENNSLSKKYEELQLQYTEMESKAVEPSDGSDPHRHERISVLEQDNKRLIQENQKLNAQIVSFHSQFGGKETEWKAVAMQMAEEMAARANASTEDVLRHFEAPGYY